MLLFKTLLISTLLFSYSARNPAYEQLPDDYEVAAGMTFTVPRIPKLTTSLYFLYEREIGVKGNGHEIDMSYMSYLSKSKHPIDADITYKFKSYYREVNNFSIQTLDTVIKITDHIDAGATIASQSLKDYYLMAYAGYEIDWLKIVFRFNNNNIIKDFYLGKEYHAKGDLYIEPFIKYISINRKKDWQAKILLKLKFL